MRLGVLALERHRQAGAARHELDEAAEERPLAMDRVETLRLFARKAHEAQRPEAEPLLLEVGEDLSGVSGGDGVRLDDGEGGLHGSALLPRVFPGRFVRIGRERGGGRRRTRGEA